ncbi:hypothetical protein ABVT39_024146 [Epinephelus coioides]
MAIEVFEQPFVGRVFSHSSDAMRTSTGHTVRAFGNELVDGPHHFFTHLTSTIFTRAAMAPVQCFTMTCDALNEEGTFSEGDTITGEITLALSKDTTVKRLFVKAKGDAESGQGGSTKKELGLFSSGYAIMDVIIEKKVYAPGETMVIVAKINNSSSRGMTPKFRLVQEVVYHANGNFRRQCNVIHRLVDQRIESRTHKDARCTIWIPDDLLPTIQNCNIISVTYHLKVCKRVSLW